ncbi:DUF6406 domain-containing protein [Streptomyces sp. NPDC057939]|uniref:DUF6406 domain-containing protein n=1 Tax=Streptomyces sp. NPDC057939 TaxID=3346284 RepID=UPI0036E39EB7
MDDEIFLRHGVPEERGDVTYIVRRVRAPEGGPVSVALVVASEGEQNHDLIIGDVFSVGDEVWSLDRVENLPRPDWWVVLRKVH